MIITCRACKQSAVKSSQAGNICTPCYKAYQKEYRTANKAKIMIQRQGYRGRLRENPTWAALNNKRSRECQRQIRHEGIMAYGGYICNCCGETEPKFMTLDHMLNNGADHRRTMGKQNSARAPIWRWLKKNGYPAGFQVLCYNCNAGRHLNGGICPHKTTQEKPREFRENPIWAILSEAS